MSDAAVEAVLDRFATARQRYETEQAELESVGVARVERVADRLRRLDRLLETYEDRATGSGDFGEYVRFRQEVDAFVEELPEDLPHRESFEEVGEIVDQRRLSTNDFERARDAVDEPRELVARLDDLEAAREGYRDVRTALIDRMDDLDERIDELDRVLAHEEADLEAPVDVLRGPIEAYNDAVHEAFQQFKRTASAPDVLALFALADRYPLVPMDPPPPSLRRYLEEAAGDLTVTEVLEYADYSHSKLSHYVDDSAAFKEAIATDRIYLERVDASPFAIPWPPPPPDALRWRIRELIPVVDRFAPGHVIERLRTVRELTRDAERYERLRAAAVAQTELSRDHQARLRSGRITADRAALVRARERLESVLETAPDP